MLLIRHSLLYRLPFLNGHYGLRRLRLHHLQRRPHLVGLPLRALHIGLGRADVPVHVHHDLLYCLLVDPLGRVMQQELGHQEAHLSDGFVLDGFGLASLGPVQLPLQAGLSLRTLGLGGLRGRAGVSPAAELVLLHLALSLLNPLQPGLLLDLPGLLECHLARGLALKQPCLLPFQLLLLQHWRPELVVTFLFGVLLQRRLLRLRELHHPCVFLRLRQQHQRVRRFTQEVLCHHHLCRRLHSLHQRNLRVCQESRRVLLLLICSDNFLAGVLMAILPPVLCRGVWRLLHDLVHH
mmetsp:Transcript_12395/g.20988  ORF Transcript_12395/g.20988 Transcript_12395/m.20988 type:complete len:294 (+) Transcript_12395:756-1637(+)